MERAVVFVRFHRQDVSIVCINCTEHGCTLVVCVSPVALHLNCTMNTQGPNIPNVLGQTTTVCACLDK